MKDFQPKQANLAINAELLFQGFVIEHNLPLAFYIKENKNIIGIGCPWHLSALTARQGGKALRGFDPEDFVIDLYNHFDKR